MAKQFSPDKVLRELVLKSHQYGDFILSSGGRDKEYFDLTPMMLNNIGLRLLVDAVNRLLDGIEFSAIACVELAPVPFIGAFVISRSPSVEGLVARKQRKGHGTNKLIEGVVYPGERVVVFEDVTSTGASVLKAIHALEWIGCIVVAVVTVINRQEGCDEALSRYIFKWLFTKKELNKVESEESNT